MLIIWGGVILQKIIQVLFILLPLLFPLLQVDGFLLNVVSACIRPCDTNKSTQSLTIMHIILQLNVYNVYMMRKLVGHPP